jgi:ACS family hexuronate transporter-like MFS transporter
MANGPAPPAKQDTGARPGPGRHGWLICALLFLATTINYVDRQVIGVLKPTLKESLHWDEIDYSHIVLAFQLAYAFGLILMGRLVDRIGVKIGLGLAVTAWSVAAMAHGLARTALEFGMARFGLGLAEAGNFPAAVKAVGEWFPKPERALAVGLFNAGSNVGALITPLVVPWMAVRWGWQFPFYVTGALGFFWLVGWLWLYDLPGHPAPAGIDPGELADAVPTVPWLSLLGRRQTWAFAVTKLLTDPIWWFYLYWIPGFLHDRHGLELLSLGPPLVVIYLMADVGSVGGGWLSSTFIKHGWTVNSARKTAMLVCALCVVPVFFASAVSNLWLATVLIGLAASAHQGFSANLFTLVSDTVPDQAVSSVTGIGGMAGAVGGMVFAEVTGHVLQWTGDYHVLFAVASVAYLVALGVCHLLNPGLQMMRVGPGASTGERAPAC